MTNLDVRTGMELMDRDECVRRLAQDDVGRLAVIVGHGPVILPVNYRMDGEVIVFRTGPGTKLDHGVRAPVSFEIDGIDRARRAGWSVVVYGWLEEVTPSYAAAYERAHQLPVEPWAPGEKSHWMRVVPRLITGRRTGGVAPA